MRMTVLSVVVLAALLGTGAKAEACGCSATINSTREARLADVRRQFNAATVVLLGEFASADGGITEIKIEKVWKGKVGASVRMRQSIRRGPDLMELDTCTLPITKGRYVIFAHEVEPDLFGAGVCGASGKAEYRAEVIELLDEIVKTRLSLEARSRFQH